MVILKSPTSSIQNILTLRYNPSRHPPLPKLSWTNFKEKYYDNPEKTIENYIKLKISNSIKNSDQKITIALSSGIDSTLALLMLKNTIRDSSITALSVKFSESVDESKQAARIANKFDVEHKIVYVENYLQELPHAISIIQLPFWDIHWYYVVKAARNISKTLVSGDGGDELFGGYVFRYTKFLSQVSKTSSPITRAKAYLNCHERDWVPDQEQLFGKNLRFSWDKIYRLLRPYFENKLPLLSQVFLADFNGKLLYNWLPVNTKFHRFFGMKSVTPILSKKLISYSTHLPEQLKYDKKSNVGKLPLRKILEKYSAQNLLSKKKQGFSVDTMNLWKSYGYDLCNYYLDNSRIVEYEWINQDWLDKHFRKNISSVRYANKFLGLLALEIWCRLFFTKEMKSSEKLII